MNIVGPQPEIRNGGVRFNMKSKSLVVVLVALLVVAGIAFWRAAVPRASAGTVQPDVASLALVPAQATTVFGVDLDGLRSSVLYSKWRQRLEQKRRDADYNEFVTRTGFDVERDLQGVTAAAWKNTDVPVFLAVVTARYNRASLSAFLVEKGAKVENYRGFELLRPDRAGHGSPSGSRPHISRGNGALVLLDDRTILAGVDTAVKQALDLKLQPGQSVLANSALLERVRKIGAENQLWAVSTAPGAFLPAEIPVGKANVARVLKGLQGSTFAINATSGLKLLIEGSCASAEDAQTLAEAARGILAMLRLAAPSDRPEALELLNSFQVQQEESQVRVTGQVSAQLLNELIENPLHLFPRQHGGKHRAQPIN